MEVLTADMSFAASMRKLNGEDMFENPAAITQIQAQTPAEIIERRFWLYLYKQYSFTVLNLAFARPKAYNIVSFSDAFVGAEHEAGQSAKYADIVDGFNIIVTDAILHAPSSGPFSPTARDGLTFEAFLNQAIRDGRVHYEALHGN